MQEPVAIDAYKPAEIARRMEEAGIAKSRLALVPLMTLAVLAGAFIAFGGALYTAVMTGVDPSGPMRLLGGVAFSLGLILVIVGGAELFTGNALIVMAWADHKVETGALLRNWGVVFAGNAIGAIGIAMLMLMTGLWDGPTGATAAKIAEGKAALSPLAAFARGILCNALVCLAVWLTMGARTVTGKILAILWPIAGFVALGFEHSIANLYMMPAGMLAGGNLGLGDMFANLVPVTLGNILGGAGGVALSYRLAYRPGG